MSPELETLDQLLTGDMQLLVIRKLFNDDAHFRTALMRMADAGDIELLDENDRPLPLWQSRIVLDAIDVSALQHHRVRITSAGVNRIT